MDPATVGLMRRYALPVFYNGQKPSGIADLTASTDYIVAGDKDLLVLEKFENVHLFSPRTFADALR